MKHLFFMAAGFMLLSHSVQAQFKARELKKVLELAMPKTAEDDMPGTRGASVVWHPMQKKYYACFAGNTSYPLAAFDAEGKRLSSAEQTALADVRGLWYNAATKVIEGNGYGSFGWFQYTLDEKGMINELEVKLEGMHQPNEQSQGAYDSANKKIAFINGSRIAFYTLSGEKTEQWVSLHWGRTKSQGESEDAESMAETPESYNTTALIITQIPGAEIGVLNTSSEQVELYDRSTGFLTQKLKLPAGAPAQTIFNFAYANGIFWFFNMDKRTWVGCK